MISLEQRLQRIIVKNNIDLVPCVLDDCIKYLHNKNLVCIINGDYLLIKVGASQANYIVTNNKTEIIIHKVGNTTLPKWIRVLPNAINNDKDLLFYLDCGISYSNSYNHKHL